MRTSRQMLKQVRRALCTAIAFSGCINLLFFATPLFALQVFHTVVPAGNPMPMAVLGAFALAAIITLAILEGVRDNILLRSGLWLDHHLGEHILNDGVRRGAVSSELQQDAQALQRLRAFLTSSAIVPLLNAPWVPVFLCALILIHPYTGILAVGCATLLVCVAMAQSVFTTRLARETSLAEAQSQSWHSEVAGRSGFAGARGSASGAAGHWELLNRRHIAGMYALGKRTSAIKMLSRVIRMGAQIALYGVGAWLMASNELSPGALVASAILLSRALAPIELVIGSFKEAQAAYSCYRRLNAMPEGSTGDALTATSPVTQGIVNLSGVSYVYPNRKAPALRGISLSLRQGQCLAISGPNGSGKSTLASILAGAVVPTSGAAELDGTGIATRQRASIGPLTGYLADAPVLFDGSIRDNISRFQDATLQSIVSAAAMAQVHDILSALPAGYDTPVGPGGSGLSLRERRAVALARAVHSMPRIIVLDEPDLGLESADCGRLAIAVQDMLAAGMSVVIATQNPQLIALAGQVAILDGGMIRAFQSSFNASAFTAPSPAFTLPRAAACAGVH